MEKYFESLGLNVIFSEANPLSTSDPAIPEINPRTVHLEVGSINGDGAFALPVGIVADYDVAIQTRDGTVLRGDVFRPKGKEQVPVILSYTHFSKHGGWWNEQMHATKFGVPAHELSGLQAFEAPDPGWWCAKGYAVAVVDAAGTSQSEGDEVFMGSASGRNVSDVIEWLAEQSWCTGKVGMAGNSALAMIQWAAAAERPPHLAAIAPWESATDLYRDMLFRGGIPDAKFVEVGIVPWIYGKGLKEGIFGAMMRKHPLMNAYWADKRAAFERIDIPAYVVASWSHVVHPRGTLQAFREMSSQEKWLRVHNNMEWIDIADPASMPDLQKFFDRYLKDEDNGWEETPRVRLSVLDPGGTDVVHRPETEWPLARQQWKTLYLNVQSSSLSDAKPDLPEVAKYDSQDAASSVKFYLDVDEDTEFTGYMTLHLWVEAPDADDMDIFAAVYKEDKEGNRLHHITMKSEKTRADVLAMEENGKLPGTLSYTGPLGRLRVSHRGLDPDRSTPSEPYLHHEREEKITPGECVPVELALWPTAMILRAGQRLVVEIAGHPLGPPAHGVLPGEWTEIPTLNKGVHRIRTGGDHDSHLLIPQIP
ncbi:putative hydrolase, CocE/NonD family [Mycobacteroides abscessus subsp. bolletii]|uniref:CocE/NonD family hydrolase n=1 Tax=Mycobacteroides abscessus TaxID=36809 RepID=UPI0009A66232|nr:CocE/NonD family hydrolase [Mycobacteroides abscessus]SKG68584.1 putative hydrolase, CocE/NonD family [Mycobacteroides abscessus subsp. bolletii]SKH13014.1 putative hydrolase, CocE/NonD family [Mycobacteroides abscessus subsp. bolletii]